MLQTDAPAVPSRLPSLSALRVPAALAVVLVHALPYLLPSPATAGLVSSLHAVMTLFFVISGFVIAWSCDHVPARRFWWRRAARIFPLHACALVLAILVTALRGYGFPTLLSAVAVLGLASSWTGNLNSAFAINGPAWSLAVEATFYALYPGLRRLPLGPAVRRPEAALWFLAGTALTLSVGVRVLVAVHSGAASAVDVDRWLYVFPPARLPELLAGMVLARAVAAGWRPRTSPARAAWVLVGLHVAVSVLAQALLSTRNVVLPSDITTFIWIVPCGALVASLACRDLDGARSTPGLWARAGDYTLAVYLFHSPLIGVLFFFSPPWTPNFGSGAIRLGILLAMVVATAAVVHHRIEQPAVLWARGLERQRRARPAQSPSSSQDLVCTPTAR